MIALIDGDIILHQAAWFAKDLASAKASYRKIIKEIVEALFASDYAVALGTSENFRKDLYSNYKLSSARKVSNNGRKLWFEELRTYAQSLNSSAVCFGYEADDLLRIWSVELGDKPHAIASIDKDLHCIPGLHYNNRTDTIYRVTEDFADHHYWKQMLMGDGIDNIPGISKCGPVKAELILSGLTTSKQRKEATCRAYFKAYGEEGYENLLANARLIHIWRHYGDHFKLTREVFNEAIKERE